MIGNDVWGVQSCIQITCACVVRRGTCILLLCNNSFGCRCVVGKLDRAHCPMQRRALFLCYPPHPQLLCCLAHTPAVHLNSLGTATKLTTFGGVLSYDSRRKHAAPARLPPTFGVHLSISERFAVLSDVVITMSMSNIVNPPNKVPSGCDSSCHRHSTTTACRHLSCR